MSALAPLAMWLPALLSLALVAPPSQLAGMDVATTKLLAQIAAAGDDARQEQFYELARPGGEARFDALVMAIDWLTFPDAFSRAYRAFWFFRKDRVLAPRAVEYLTDR